MNIWAIDKDESIKLLLLLLTQELGANSFAVAENLKLDPRSVRLHKTGEPLICTYIYTYGESAEKYGIHLEFPFHDEADISSSMDIYEGVSFDRLVDLLRTHFNLTL